MEYHEISGSELSQKSCKPCEGGARPMDRDRIEAMLRAVPGWQFEDGAVTKTYQFKNYHETIGFVNATAWISNREDHHPDLEVSYRKCKVRYSTHAIGGISENDFICAAKLEALFLK